MHPSTHLHQLLHALSQAEKRYLRLYATRHSKKHENQTAWLLDAIWQQESYEEEILKQQWAANGFKTNQFAVAKNYLFAMALQAMRDFHREANPRRIVVNLLADADFLYSRNMLVEAHKFIVRASNMAQQYELADLVLQADMLSRTLELRNNGPELMAHLKELEASSAEAFSLLEAIVNSSVANTTTTAQVRRSLIARDEDSKRAVFELSSKAAKAAGNSDGHFLPQFYNLRTQLLVAQMQNDMETMWTLNQQLLAHWLAYPHMREAHSAMYLISLVNLLNACQVNDRSAEMPRILDLLAAITPHSPLEKVEIAHNLAYYRLLYAMNTQQWPRVGPLTDELQAVAKIHGPKIPKARLTAIQYNVAIAYFFLEDHKKALQACNNILNDKQSQHREDLQQAARLLQAVVHYELGNFDLLEYLLRSLKRYLQTKGGLHAFEANLVKTLRDLLAKPQQKVEIMHALEENLKALQNDPSNAHAPGLEEMQHWVTAKLLNRPIREMLGRNS